MEPKKHINKLFMDFKTVQKCYSWNSKLHCQITKRIKICKTLQSWNSNKRKAKLDATSFMHYKTISPKFPSCNSKRHNQSTHEIPNCTIKLLNGIQTSILTLYSWSCKSKPHHQNFLRTIQNDVTKVLVKSQTAWTSYKWNPNHVLTLYSWTCNSKP